LKSTEPIELKKQKEHPDYHYSGVCLPDRQPEWKYYETAAANFSLRFIQGIKWANGEGYRKLLSGPY
jgi:hypothetical protein